MKLGNLTFIDVKDKPDSVPDVVRTSIDTNNVSHVLVSDIDPSLSDTAAFCEAYDIPLDISVNCVIIEAKRADKVWYAACLIPATERADINGVIRKQLDARKVSFASMELATSMTHMEYGGITPIGLPVDWPIIVDASVSSTAQVIIGSGYRKSKLLVEGKLLTSLPNSIALDITKK